VVIESIPGGGFVFEFVAAVTVIGAAGAHRRHQRDRTFKVDPAIANYAFVALVLATGIQVLLVLFT
jgi:hypothetical protein